MEPRNNRDDRPPPNGPEGPLGGGGGGQVLTWLVIGFAGLAILLAFMTAQPTDEADVVPLSRVVQAIRAGQANAIQVEGDELEVTLADGTTVISRKEPGLSLTETLRQFGVPDERIAQLQVEVVEPPDFGWLGSLLWLLPLFLVLIMFLGLRRGAGAGGGGTMDQVSGFLRSRARRASPDRPQVHFSDVAGVEAAKQELTEVVEFLRNPRKFTAIGARVPRGVLLAGPPGTGKTLLARAVAGEAGVAFFSISASEFVELFVGVGASRVRDLFKQARENAPAIIFIDEIDAIGRRRGSGLTQSHEEREQTLNQILAEMDGFDERANVIVMAATNRPDVLDPALLRPGRFDRRVTIDNPERDDRLAILKVHARGKPIDADVNLEDVAKATVGFSGADLENLLNEAALLAARRGKRAIGRVDLDEAADRVMAGPRRRGHRMNDWERKLVAYHEGGHALVAHRLPHADPVHRVSIVARGAAGGHTRVLPEEERSFWTRSQLRDTLAYTLGGLVAEELIFGEPTTGPGSDLERASEVARKMVLEFGMSTELGPVVLGKSNGDSSGLGIETRSYSEETAASVDAEVRRLVEEAHDRARETLATNLPDLHKLAEHLIEQETLHGEDINALLGPPAGRHNPYRQESVAKPESAAQPDLVVEPELATKPESFQTE